MKHGSRQQWEEFGYLCCEINNKLVEAYVMGRKLLPQNKISELEKADHLLIQFRSRAEELMFSRDQIKDIHIMYPGHGKLQSE